MMGMLINTNSNKPKTINNNNLITIKTKNKQKVINNIMTFEMYSSKNNDIVKEEEWKMETISRVDEVIECDADIENDEDEGQDELVERLSVLSDCRSLKNLAMAFLHPEIPVHAHPALYGRNYFNRYEVSKDVGDEEDSKDNEMEFGEIMMDVQKLRDAARIYLRPEIRTEIKLDSECFGRNYFSRYSAPNVENKCYADERVGVLADAAVLKKAATSYMHPEIGIKKTDGEMFGRNYFNRYSAPETEEHEFANERAEILTEAAALKKSAIAFMHPEFGVTSTDGQMFGRNYFERPSAPNVESIDEADERAIVLADAAALKKSAIAYMHPEVGVTSTDGEIFGRNYFHRYSAPETEWVEFADERAEILAEAAALKTSAMAYMHPELGVSVEDSTVFGRNYFSRYSAYPIESLNKANERALVLAEAAALKKSAIDYMHPEIGVKCTGGAVFGRNYFNRFSACLEGAKCPKVSGAPSQDLTAICNLGKAIKGMNLPSTASSSKNLSERVRDAPKSASVVQLFGLSDDLI